MSLTVIILTKDEEKHIRRAMDSVSGIATRIVVVDSGSTDDTVRLAREAGAEVLVNPFVTQAIQFNWALDRIDADGQWILRLDADEIVTPALREMIRARLPKVAPDVMGIEVGRRISFLGRPIRWGGVFPIRLVRLFRQGKGRCEDRWMDEHIVVDGKVEWFDAEIIDDNLNPLTWWIDKHNKYASREVIEILNHEHGFLKYGYQNNRFATKMSPKRWIKKNVYDRLPATFRSFVYFSYRFFVRFGFLDGREGMAFHVLQGFWYRYVVDLKLHEVRSYMRENNVGAVTAIKDVLSTDLMAAGVCRMDDPTRARPG